MDGYAAIHGKPVGVVRVRSLSPRSSHVLLNNSRFFANFYLFHHKFFP
ncbi:MAG: hypothetical protein Ct9H300mP14_03860 [Gammaproteobacteria bacterium]|nr:MAG: hypothetical protein Ct9H300mP14_03860 [Gammaproteobacteria bacterium]